MDSLAIHEKFEIEALDALNSQRLLEMLLFGGGTMLRLCHGLNRYSVVLDFYLLKRLDKKQFHKNMLNCLSKQYILTDAAIKHFTLLYEFRSRNYPRRLKIEIRKQPKPFEYEEIIAYSAHSTKQILVKALTLKQMMLNKVEAILERTEIRDYFDLEFILRRGIKIVASKAAREKIRSKISSFKKRDFSVALGSLLNPKDREYYTRSGFKFLISQL